MLYIKHVLKWNYLFNINSEVCKMHDFSGIHYTPKNYHGESCVPTPTEFWTPQNAKETVQNKIENNNQIKHWKIGLGDYFSQIK